METRIALIGIIVEDTAATEALNGLLHEYGEYIVGRMGIPYRSKNVCIISVVVDAPMQAISSLSGKLGMISGISVKLFIQRRVPEMKRIQEMNAKELAKLLEQPDFREIYQEADAVRRKTKGDIIQIRAILEFSNHCRRQCRYCGLNSRNGNLKRYRMAPEEMVETAEEAINAGYRTIVLQSGEDPWYTPEMLGGVIREIKKMGAAVTVSCGEFPREVYAYWKDCGADRYLLKHETSDPILYGKLHPCGTLENRVGCLKNLKELGYEAGGGFMIGLPGQTLETIAHDLLLLREIPCDMAGIGPFIPHPDTDLRNAQEGSTELTKRAVAIARLLLPECNLPATTSLGVLDAEEKGSVFSCGANVIMRKVTPENYKKLYEIYPADLGKTDIRRERAELEEMIRSLGKEPL